MEQNKRKATTCYFLLRSYCLLLILLFSVVIREVSSSQEDGCAHVIDGTASQQSSGTWTFSATVSSTETGWDKYANEWKIETVDGTILGTRELAHPHVTEQPFTRSLSGVEIPDDVGVVVFSAQDSVLGYCEDTFELMIRETIASTANTTSTNTTTTPQVLEPISPSSSNASDSALEDDSSAGQAPGRCRSSKVVSLLAALVFGFGGGLDGVY